MSEPIALKLHHVSHDYDRVQAVAGVELEVGPGEVVCLVGPSGCGKSTILRLAAGLEAVQQGTIKLHGKLVGDGAGSHVPPEERHVGLVFQDFALFPHLNVGANVAFGLRSLDQAERTARVAQTLRQVGLAELHDSYPHALSGGQQQRVALARALAPKPRMMLMDEPFSGLDARLRDQVRDDTLHVLRRHGTATLLVTHDPEEALFMADRIYLMKDGAIVQAGDPQEIYHRPRSLFAAGFFSSINNLVGHLADGRVATAMGHFAATPGERGTRLTVAFRPESLLLAETEPRRQGLRAQAIVEESYFLGADWRIRLSTSNGAHDPLQLIARGKGRPPGHGQSVPIFVAHEDLFLFPDGE